MRNDGRKTALHRVQSRCFFKRVRSPGAVRRRTSAIWRRILTPSAAKVMSILRGKTEGELRSPARSKATTDYPRNLFPTAAWPNVNWTSPGVALLVSIARLGKSSQTFLYFSDPARSCAQFLELDGDYRCRVSLGDGGV